MTPPHLLRAEGLACGYRRRGDVLAGVNLDVVGGSVLAILGPNGSGKTTLMRTLGQMLRPRGGTITLDGEPIHDRRSVAITTDETPADSTLSVAEVVRLGRAARRGWWWPMTESDRAVIDDVLQRADLDPLRDRPVTELSAGEWQRVLLARALAQEPTVLLLDEPTAHLDLRYQCEFLDLVADLAHDGGMAVALSLHDLNQAALWADRVALVADGGLVAVGPTAEVLTADRLERAYRCPVRVETDAATGAVVVLPRRRGGRPVPAAVPRFPGETASP